VPRFICRLEAQDGSGHFRESEILITEEDMANAGNDNPKEVAKMILLEREQRKADYRLTTEQFNELASLVHPSDLEARDELAAKLVNDGIKADGFYDLPGNIRAEVATHHQAEPYDLVSINKVKGS
jgi:hypothetical protein